MGKLWWIAALFVFAGWMVGCSATLPQRAMPQDNPSARQELSQPQIPGSHQMLRPAALPDVKKEPKSVLEKAILELAPEYMADIPINQRSHLLEELRTDPADHRLDIENQCLHFYSDEGGHDGVGGTSMLYMKVFQRKNGGKLVLVHMPKPLANDSTPQANQTFCFENRNQQWVDVTRNVFPAGVDLTAYFNIRRSLNVIEVAPYKRVARRDNRGDSWQVGQHSYDLIWNGDSFEKRTAKTTEVSYDD